MKNSRGSMTIVALIIFTLMMVVAVFLLDITEVETIYNFNSNEALQHKFILDSHFNYMTNKPGYYGIIENYVIDSIKKQSVKKLSFQIDEKLVDNKESTVILEYDIKKDLLRLVINNQYKQMHKHLVIKSSMINPIFTDKSEGIIIYGNENLKTRDQLDEIFNEVFREDYRSDKYLTLVDGDLILEEDLELQGLLIVKGDIITGNHSLKIAGLIICGQELDGDFELMDQDNRRKICLGACELPGFIVPEISSKQFLEGLEL